MACLLASSLFYLSIFKLPIGVGKRLEGLMRRFLWKGTGLGQRRGQAMVSWEIACKPIKAGGLGILDIHNMSTTLLTKWVARRMSSWEDLVTQILKESYGGELNWEKYAAPVYGASSFWHGSRHIFRRVRAFFAAQLGDGSSFQY